jgi:membrane-associated phospholipid phosphatase
VLFSTIGAILFFIIQPKYIPSQLAYNIIAVVFLSTYLIPVLFLFVLVKKKSVESFHLNTIKERKFPILFFIILTVILGFRLSNLKIVDLLAYSFIASTLALVIVYLLFFTKLKTSLHTLGIGGLTGFLMVLSYHYEIKLLPLIALFFILFGIISFSRLKLKAHTQTEIYLGFIIGILSQIITYTVFQNWIDIHLIF